ncbi:MAG: hypothetical protein DMD79_22350 [Candidatus Rokuibacteriota bacterium]|nr:MAG: hypothetical protein DMD79_22350 [Candidatus Rokubacteria bacterium]
MRWVRSLARAAAMALAVVAGPDPAHADLWDTLVSGSVTATQIDVTRGDQTGLTWRGGPQLSLPSGGGGPVVRVEAGAGGGCGITDFVSEFKAMFSTQALENYFEGLIGTAIASAPLVLLCYASPTLCDAYKHFKSMTSEVLSLRAGECRAVEQAAANLGTSLNRQQQLACIDERIAAGDPSWVALDACKASSQSTTLDYGLRRVGDLSLVRSSARCASAAAGGPPSPRPRRPRKGSGARCSRAPSSRSPRPSRASGPADGSRRARSRRSRSRACR